MRCPSASGSGGLSRPASSEIRQIAPRVREPNYMIGTRQDPDKADTGDPREWWEEYAAPQPAEPMSGQLDIFGGEAD